MKIKPIKTILVLSWLLFIATTSLFSNIEKLPIRKVGKQYLVIIAINEYKNNWQDLEFPVRDGREIEEILNEYYYIDETILLFNQQANKQGILDLLKEELTSKLTNQDSILLYYAGHSKIDKHDDTPKENGYWIPFDAHKTDKKTWINNKEILKAIENWNVKHVLLIVDSCFAGSLLYTPYRGDESGEIIQEPFKQKQYAKPSCLVIASSPPSEMVPDDSVFSLGFKKYLINNKKPYIDTHDIYYYLYNMDTREDIPLPIIGVLKNEPGEPEGSMLLFKKPYTFDLIKEKFSLSISSGFLFSEFMGDKINIPLAFEGGFKLVKMTDYISLSLGLQVQYQEMNLYTDESFLYATLGILPTLYITRHFSMELYLGLGSSLMWDSADYNVYFGSAVGIKFPVQMANHVALEFSVSDFLFLINTPIESRLYNIVNLKIGLKLFL